MGLMIPAFKLGLPLRRLPNRPSPSGPEPIQAPQSCQQTHQNDIRFWQYHSVTAATLLRPSGLGNSRSLSSLNTVPKGVDETVNFWRSLHLDHVTRVGED